MDPNAIRQAALVLAKLDRTARDTVLDRMPTEQATQLRGALLSLDPSDYDTQETAVRDFLLSRSQASERVEVDFSEPPIRDVTPSPVVATTSSSLHDLLRHTDESITSLLLHERATTVAALLSSLPGERAAGILRLIPSQLRARVVAIWDAGISANMRAVDAIAEWICDHLTESNIEPTVAMQQHSALKAILDQFGPSEREELLQDLAKENPLLAKRLAEQTTIAVEA